VPGPTEAGCGRRVLRRKVGKGAVLAQQEVFPGRREGAGEAEAGPAVSGPPSR